MLKYISTFANLQSPIVEVQEAVARKTAEVAKRSMGRLVVEAANTLHQNPEPTQPALAVMSEAWFSYSFTLGESKKEARDWRKVMTAVVAERNVLIHQMLATFNPSSIESCEALCTKLDDQRSRIVSAYEHLESIVLAIQESHRDLATIVDGMVD